MAGVGTRVAPPAAVAASGLGDAQEAAGGAGVCSPLPPPRGGWRGCARVWRGGAQGGWLLRTVPPCAWLTS